MNLISALVIAYNTSVDDDDDALIHLYSSSTKISHRTNQP
jgi:hypothetical protein